VIRRLLGAGAIALFSLLASCFAGACASDATDPAAAGEPDAALDGEPVDATPPIVPGDGGEAGVLPPGCSEDGWCIVSVPALEGISLSAVWGSSSNDVWAVGAAGTIAHFDGAEWSVLPKNDAGTDQTLFTVWGSGSNDVWAGSTERVILHSDGWKEGHATWSRVEGSASWKKRLDDVELSEQQGTFRVWSIWGAGADDVWMLPNDTIRAWHADGFRGGATDWQPVLDYFSQTAISFKGTWGSSRDDVWVVGDEGKILHARGGYRNGLVDWEVVNSGTQEDFDAIWGTASDDIWAVGRLGTVRHFTYDTSGTLRWVPSSSGVDVELLALWGSGPNDIWAVGDAATILHGDGDHWSRSRLPPLAEPAALRGVWGSSNEDVWAVGDGVLLHRGHAQQVER
jgi:hypothetical protein